MVSSILLLPPFILSHNFSLNSLIS
jgi:hypothetical protein